MYRKLTITLSNQEWIALVEMLILFPVDSITPASTHDMVSFIMNKLTNRLQSRETKKKNNLILKAHEIAAMNIVIQLMADVMDLGVYETNLIDSISNSFCKWQADRYNHIHNITYGTIY
ncbi:MAG: hypothetical protein Q8O72_10485 [Bacteroidales bacterium]|nr:hypothetical protein [Bacteroidales bacterium]